MNFSKLAKMMLATMAIAAVSFTAKAVTIDFGTSWPAFTAPGVGGYAVSPYNRLLGAEGGTHSTESDIATFLNSIVGSSFVAADIHKTDNPPELGGSDGFFTVPSGWQYLVVQYDGPNGGSIVLDLGGNDAKVPFDSSLIWGSDDQFGVSHFSVAGDPSTSVPDGGSTAALLGFVLVGVEGLRRKLSGQGVFKKA